MYPYFLFQKNIFIKKQFYHKFIKILTRVCQNSCNKFIYISWNSSKKYFPKNRPKNIFRRFPTEWRVTPHPDKILELQVWGWRVIQKIIPIIHRFYLKGWLPKKLERIEYYIVPKWIWSHPKPNNIENRSHPCVTHDTRHSSESSMATSEKITRRTKFSKTRKCETMRNRDVAVWGISYGNSEMFRFLEARIIRGYPF